MERESSFRFSGSLYVVSVSCTIEGRDLLGGCGGVRVRGQGRLL